jgi:hypothetical protein
MREHHFHIAEFTGTEADVDMLARRLDDRLRGNCRHNGPLSYKCGEQVHNKTGNQESQAKH